MLTLENLTGEGFRNVSLTLNAGEICGAGWAGGTGRTELAETLYGLRTLRGGRVMLNGKRSIRYPLENVYCAVWFICRKIAQSSGPESQYASAGPERPPLLITFAVILGENRER